MLAQLLDVTTDGFACTEIWLRAAEKFAAPVTVADPPATDKRHLDYHLARSLTYLNAAVASFHNVSLAKPESESDSESDSERNLGASSAMQSSAAGSRPLKIMSAAAQQTSQRGTHAVAPAPPGMQPGNIVPMATPPGEMLGVPSEPPPRPEGGALEDPTGKRLREALVALAAAVDARQSQTTIRRGGSAA